ncbi:hypothetical protein C8A01DRAFT_45661 [Parachaetomium inaequale]|uniref:Zn(2)-C6 fungal-type domain-containing protein n=1 Tax=Parachaetomium inaequale TaxID=2588326 RepID=A0AAN6SSX8_9PEZI|nr:hypothetical protein C8A01DRAFT_45661 [Parachaetomium inaequale]
MDEDETVGSGRSSSEPVQHKTRRPHRKSRYGCTKCKARRIKCDEGTPRCSRCEKMNLSCQYRKKKEADGWTEPPDYSWLAQTLDATEFELLKHYLEHTSRDPSVGDQDKYTLQIGIPNLACQCKPLMRSVLALAAVCKCCDIINQPPESVGEPDRGKVIQLLSLAHRYHLESLRDIQATLYETKNYDHVLANAAMMGMYGSASHAARIWLAKTAPFGEDLQLFNLTMPGHPQWMSLFRAVRLAYAGLLRNSPQIGLSPASSPGDVNTQYEYKVSARAPAEDASTFTITTHPLGPILAATVRSALARVDEKALEIQAIAQATNDHNHELQACFTTLGIFSNIVNDSLLPGNHSTPRSTPARDHVAPPIDFDNDPVGQLSEISPWLRKYTASISSMIPSNVPRRAIMSFVHKVPTTYLNLIEDMIVLMETEPSALEMMPEPSIAHQFAVEIFAHWLVLVILLDNVWWIGGIGAWELERFVSVRKHVAWSMCLWNRDRDWWPESMLEISRQFDKYR